MRFDECDESELVDVGEWRHVLGCDVEMGAGAGTGAGGNCALSCHC